MIIYVLLGLIAGFLSGLSGLSPGCFITPVLITALSTPYDEAINASLMVVFCTSLFSYMKKKEVSIHHMLIIGIPSGLFAIIGDVYLRHFAFPPLLLEFFVVGMMFLAADLSKLSGRAISLSAAKPAPGSHFLLALGSLSGLCASLLGLSGSIFMTPLIALKSSMKYKEAMKIAAFSAMVASLFALISEFFYQQLPWAFSGYLIIGGIVGAFFGGLAQKHIKDQHLVRFNYWAFIVLGYFVLAKLLYNSL